jgi:hypothetical protein
MKISFKKIECDYKASTKPQTKVNVLQSSKQKKTACRDSLEKEVCIILIGGGELLMYTIFVCKFIMHLLEDRNGKLTE